VGKSARWLGVAAIVGTFLGCGAKPDSPLSTAAAEGRMTELSALLAQGADANASDASGMTPLIWAAREGRAEAVRVLLAAGADPLKPAGVNGWTPLEHAIHKGQNEAATFLLEAASHRREELDRALVMAAGYGNPEMVRALLARGADPRAKVGGATAIANAVGGAWDIDSSFAGCGPHTEVVKALFERAPDLELGDGFWERYAASYAKRQNCTEIMQLLQSRAGVASAK
jgi:ankyrin repeat protein